MANAKFIDAATWAALPEIDVTNGEDLFPQLGAGTFRPVLSGVASVIIPSLTAGSIVEVSPTVGDTLTVSGSNATGTATFQWQVDTGGGYGDVSGATSATLDTTGEPAGDYRRGVTDGVHVLVYTAGVTVAEADVTAPILSAPTGAANGSTGATSLGVTTDEGNGTLYWGIYPDASTPSAADIVAGTGATVSGSQAVSGTGAQVVADQTGLTAETGYKAHYVHDDASTNRSNTVATATFTTEAAAAGPTLIGNRTTGEAAPVYTNSFTALLHASAAENQAAIITIACDGEGQTITAPAGWTPMTQLDLAVGTGLTHGYSQTFYKNAITAGEAASGVLFTSATSRSHSSISAVYSAGSTIGNATQLRYPLDNPARTFPSIAVSAGSTTYYVDVFNGKQMSPTPTPDYISNTATHSGAKTIAVWFNEDEAGPNSTTLTVDALYNIHNMYVIEVQ